MEREHANKAEQAEHRDATRDDAASRPAHAPDEALMRLQQTAGNRAVGRLLLSHIGSGDRPPPPSPTPDAAEGARPGPATLAALGNGGGGESLPAPLLSRAERTLGADLNGVRLHTGADASNAARELEANAFTHGRDIYFGGGKFEPDTARGRRLLLHELVHTVQQRPAEAGAGLQDFTVSEPGEPAEVEAHAAASRALSGEGVAPPSGSVPPGRIMRDYVRVPVIEPDEDELRSGEGEVPYEEEEEDEGLLAPASAPDFPLEVKRVGKGEEGGEEELVFIVPADIDREGIARRLFDDPQKARAFDIVPAGELKTEGGRPARAVRVRDLKSLTPAAAEPLRQQLESELAEDVRWTVEKLKERIIDNEDELQLLARAVKWSQRSDWKDVDGNNYFDRYLDALSAHPLTASGLTGDETHDALYWLIRELEEKSGYLTELLAHRSKGHKPAPPPKVSGFENYLTTQEREVTALGPGHTVGYYKYKTPDAPAAGGHVTFGNIFVKEKLGAEATRDHAEIVARNAPTRLPRVVLPGGDGRFHIFSLDFPYFDEEQRVRYEKREPSLLQQGSPTFLGYWWVYPTVAFIRGGEYQAETFKGGIGDKSLRQQLLDEALKTATAADPSPLLGLDFDVLSLATLDQRVSIFKTVLDSKRAAETAVFDLLTRLLYTTPAREFPLLERRMSTEGITARMLQLNVNTNLLATFGRVFTRKALASQPVSAAALADMVTFKLGEDADGWYHYAVARGVSAASKVVPREEWSPADAPRVGNEPGVKGEEGGALQRTAIVFNVSKLKLHSLNPEITDTRSLLPTELVRIEVQGAHPQTLIVTAVEAAGLLDVSTTHVVKYVLTPLGKVWGIAFASAGLVRVFGAAVAEGLMTGGLRGAAAAVGEAAATQAGSSALFNALLVGSMEGVEHYRGELTKSEAGRAFLATYDVASSILIARDVFHLLSSGVVMPLAKLAGAAAAANGEGGGAALLRLQRELEAWLLAFKRMREAGEVFEGVEAATGLRVTKPKDLAKFPQYLMAAKAEMASERAVQALGAAGRETKVAKEFFALLQKEAAESEVLGRAQRAIANHIAGLDAALAEALLAKMKSVVELRPKQAAALAGYLHAATRVPNPMEFLDEVSKFVSRKGLNRKTVEVFGEKVLLHTYDPNKGADVAWLNTLEHSDGDLNAMGSDPNTPWLPIQKAVADVTAAVPKYNRLPWLRSILRGIGAEMVAGQQLRKGLIPGARVTGKQVQMLESKIDYAIELADDTGKLNKHGVEVKGYTGETFRDALNAFLSVEKLPAGATIDKETKGVISKIERMIKQLKDAKAHTGNNAFLLVSDELSGPTKNKLEDVVNRLAPGTEIYYLPESEIKEVSQRLAQGFGIPEVERLKAQAGKAGQVLTP